MSEPSESARLIRSQFPLWRHNPDLVYLDYASTAPKPDQVISAIISYYSEFPANVHRANYKIAARAEEAYEGARHAVAGFFGVGPNEVVFTKGTTEGINLVAHSFLSPRLSEGDEILITQSEHHANWIPWHLAAKRSGASLVVVPIRDDGLPDLDIWASHFSDKTKFAAFTLSSNVTGAHYPANEMVEIARRHGVPTLVDAAQAAPHQRIAFKDIDADFMVCSAHKLYGPTGVGCLIGKPESLEAMGPWQGGGDMIEDVALASVTFQHPPRRFEAGTPPIAEVIGFGAAVGFVAEHLSAAAISERTANMDTLLRGLRRIEGLKFLGEPTAEGHLCSFVVEGAHSADLGLLLDQADIAVRVGKHCAHPLLTRFEVDSSVRVSLGLPSASEDVERVLATLAKSVKVLRR